MRIQARESNYGTRVDYILVTRGLLKWIKHGDILPSIKGSDHCPIYIDLHEEITLETGETVKLQEALRQCDGQREAPRIAAKHWEEFSGKQTLLSTFFGKKAAMTSPVDPPTQSAPLPKIHPPAPKPSQANAEAGPSTVARKPSSTRPATSSTSTVSKKRSLSHTTASSSSKKKAKKDPGQATLGSFFGKPSAKSPSSTPSEVIDLSSDTEPPLSQSTDKDDDEQAQLDADYRLACELASSQEAPSASPPMRTSADSKSAWSNLFTPVQPPKCTVHGEPTKQYTVNKTGPNKGRKFYLCSRYASVRQLTRMMVSDSAFSRSSPVGPGYDKGKAERLRHEVNHEYRCNYFKWASEVKRAASTKQPP